MRRRQLLSVALLALLPIAGCSGEKKAAEPSPAELLAAAKGKVEEAKFVSFTLTSQGVPPKTNSVSAAEGTGEISATEPKFTGTITGQVNGVGGTIGLITIADKAWMKIFSSAYNPVDLKAMGAPNPSNFFRPDTGLAALLTETDKPVMGERVREGKEILRAISGTVPGSRIKDLFFMGDGTTPVNVTWGLTDGGELRTAKLSGKFYGGTEQTYSLLVKDYGKAVAITAP